MGKFVIYLNIRDKMLNILKNPFSSQPRTINYHQHENPNQISNQIILENVKKITKHKIHVNTTEDQWKEVKNSFD